MELPVLRFPHLWHNVLSENHVHWSQTPDCHIYSTDLSGLKKEEIKVEVEDSRYLIIRTQTNDSTNPDRSFMKKIRLPNMINIEATLAIYKDGHLTVRVPRLTTIRTRFFIHPSDLPQHLDVLAKAA